MPEAIEEFLADPIIGAVATAFEVALIALWLAAAWWAYRDAARRTEGNAAPLLVAGWIIVSTPLLLPLSLLIYAVVRPEATAERRARALVAELGIEGATTPICASCRGPVDAAWLRCPHCAWWLASPCAGCGTWSDRDLPACPWCGSEERTEPSVQDLAPAPAWPSRWRRARVGRVPIQATSPRVPRQLNRGAVATSNARPAAPVRSRP